MKKSFKLFLLFFVIVVGAVFLGFYSYISRNNKKFHNKIEITDEFSEEKKVPEQKQEICLDTLEKAISYRKKINFIFLGMEDVRTDTLIFISFDIEDGKVDLISIPRDTYLHRRGYDEAEQRKINSVYNTHGVEGVKKSVEYVLGNVPIHHYVMLDYKGVAQIVDSVGGVEVNVPFHMKYRDPTANPPLYIDIPKGKQKLNGKKAVDFLRYRKGNTKNSGYLDGDLGRIKAQQEFIKAFTQKALSYRMPILIKTSFDYIQTDMTLGDALVYGKNAIGIKKDDFSFTTLPGVADFKTVSGKKLSYFFYDENAVKELMEKVYGVEK